VKILKTLNAELLHRIERCQLRWRIGLAYGLINPELYFSGKRDCFANFSRDKQSLHKQMLRMFVQICESKSNAEDKAYAVEDLQFLGLINIYESF